MLVWHGPEYASHLVVLAPGDAGRVEDSPPTLIAEGLAQAGLRVVRFAAGGGDPAQLDEQLAAQIRTAAAARTPGQSLVLGGFSRGARVSTGLVDELGAAGLLAFAYPFHARNDPDASARVRQLAQIAVPALICQGTRDSHGNLQQVRGYHLPAHIRLRWLQDANHALHPRARSGQTQTQQLTEAIVDAVAFVRSLG